MSKQDLKDALYCINNLTNSYTADIYATAKALLLAMESPAFYRNPCLLASALDSIIYASENLGGEVASIAEREGCDCASAAFLERAQKHINAMKGAGNE